MICESCEENEVLEGIEQCRDCAPQWIYEEVKGVHAFMLEDLSYLSDKEIAEAKHASEKLWELLVNRSPLKRVASPD